MELLADDVIKKYEELTSTLQRENIMMSVAMDKLKKQNEELIKTLEEYRKSESEKVEEVKTIKNEEVEDIESMKDEEGLD